MGGDPVTLRFNNRPSDPRSVPVTSLIWNKCEPRVLLRCAAAWDTNERQGAVCLRGRPACDEALGRRMKEPVWPFQWTSGEGLWSPDSENL